MRKGKDKERWKQLKIRQFAWFYTMAYSFEIALLVLIPIFIVFHKSNLVIGLIVMGIIGTIFIAFFLVKLKNTRRISKLMETFVRRNNLYRSHYTHPQYGLFKGRTRNIEVIDYYPRIWYMEKENVLMLRVRLDGCLLSEKFRDMEQQLADMFCTVCTDKISERGYLTYCFELQQQEQIKIQSCKDIPPAGEKEIAFSRDITWNWESCVHLLIIGNTGSGKTCAVKYIICCLLKQGVRVIYCDPKSDNDMRLFMQTHLGVKYATSQDEIEKVVRETAEELEARELELKNIGIKDADFNPVYLFFDEMIAFAKITEKKTYEETMKRLSVIVVKGRSQKVYAGILLQRCDASYIEGAIRDNLGCRISMGRMSDTAYKMAFGSDFADVKNQRSEVGSGLIFRQGVDTVPREFLVPYIEEGALSRE